MPLIEWNYVLYAGRSYTHKHVALIRKSPRCLSRHYV